MLPKEARELKTEWVRGLIQKTLKPKGRLEARPLPTNNYERHKNWKITIHRTPPRAKSFEVPPSGTKEEKTYLLRVENPFTNKVRRMFLKDEIAVLKLLQPYRVAPKLIAHGRHDGRLFLIEEWIDAKPLSAFPRLANTHYKKIIEFMARMNSIPLAQLFRRKAAGLAKLIGQSSTKDNRESQEGGTMTRHSVSSRFRFKDDRLDRLAARRNGLLGRIRAGRAIKKFRPIIKEIMPIFETGFRELTRRVRAFPKSLWRHPVLSYRDISQTNLMMAKPRYLAADWEWHSVGIADPSLSLVVFMQRFNLLHKRKWILKTYQRLRPTPHLDKLIDARILERLLGGLTWSLGWIANMKRVGVPHKELRRAIRGGIKSTRERKHELIRLMRTPEAHPPLAETRLRRKKFLTQSGRI